MKKFKNRHKITKEKIQSYNFKEVGLTKMAKRQLYVTLLSVLGVTVATLGSAYAIFTSVSKSSDYNVVKAGTLNIDFGSDSSNVIDLSGKYPMSDSEGEALTPYTFTITNTGTLPADYEIYLEDDTDMITQDGCSTKQLDKNSIKYKLNSESARILSTSKRLLATGTLNQGESVTNKLYVWIKENASNDVLGKHYHGKIVVNGVNEVGESLTTKMKNNIPSDNLDTSDSNWTYITGTSPTNYIWYSGKLWQAYAINNNDNSIKIITKWPVATINYGRDEDYKSSCAYTWLNDTTSDGFLGNLRDYNNYINTESVWNVPTANYKAESLTSPCGLLTYAEYTKIGTSSYLNDGTIWYITYPEERQAGVRGIRSVGETGTPGETSNTSGAGIRPVVVLKGNVKTISGTGTETDPYRLRGDNDILLNGTKLNTRYSGEYISFGKGENNLYRIVSHETANKTKIVSAVPLKDSGSYKTIAFGSSVGYTNTNTIGTFLNGSYLTDYLNTSDTNMIEDTTTWYLGTVSNGESYKLGKYATATSTTLTSSKTTAKVGLLRLGELMSGQDNIYTNNNEYWLLTPITSSYVYSILNANSVPLAQSGGGSGGSGGSGSSSSRGNLTSAKGIKPAMTLKENVVITGGTGTKENPFTIKLGS